MSDAIRSRRPHSSQGVSRTRGATRAAADRRDVRGVIVAILFAALFLLLAGTTRAASLPTTAAADEGNLFEPIRTVVQHPRCMNCHVADGVPRQYDDSRPHAQNVHGGDKGFGVPGLQCSACHQTANAHEAAGPNAPPGAPNWHLAPKEMVWVDVTARDICLRLRDPKTNGGKTPEQLLHHFAEDKLVAWGWAPGGNRSVPPLTQAETSAAVEKWLDAGAPCPEA